MFVFCVGIGTARTVNLGRGGRPGGGCGAHVLHASAVRPLTTRPLGDGELLPQERFADGQS